MRLSLFAFLLPLFALADFRTEYEIGHQFALRFHDSEITRNRPYFLFKGQFIFPQSGKSTSELTLNGAGRSWLDKKENELSLRSLNVNWARGKTNLVVGFQEIAWGETFGVFIADLVNPRDLRDPFFTDLSWIRRPVFAVNGQLLLNKLSLQAVVTPIPGNNRFPYEIVGVTVLPPKQFELKRLGHDAEAGLRLGYLFDMGLDVNVFHLYHFNRNPAFDLTTSNGKAALQPVVERIHTSGITLSYALEKWVFRGDGVLHFNNPYQKATTEPVRRVRYWRSILGIDTTPTETWNFGVQYHYDHPEAEPRHWVGARVEKKLFNERLIPELFLFQGLNNPDAWIQPKITLLFATDFSASVQGDLIVNKTSPSGYLDAFQNEDRILTWIYYRF